MKESLLTPADWQSSVISVPPLARDEDLNLAGEPNRALIRHLEGGGISIIMYGGNANFYNISISEYEEVLDFLAEAVAPQTLVIPSIGPDFGRIRDQAPILVRKQFPTAMLLPTVGNMTQDGLERAIRWSVDRLGYPIVLYVKDEHYLDIERIGQLTRDGCVIFVKYAIVRPEPSEDDFLARLIEEIGVDRIVSGIGERPALAHFRDFGLRAFTTGSGSVAPANSTRLLKALIAGDYETGEEVRKSFMPLEDLRDAHGPAYVLHEAVSAAEIGDMGPMLPLMHRLPEDLRRPVADAARALLKLEQSVRG